MAVLADIRYRMEVFDVLPEYAREFARTISADARWVRDYIHLQKQAGIPDAVIEQEFIKRAKRPESCDQWLMAMVKHRGLLRVSDRDRLKFGMMGDLEKAIRGMI